MQSSSLPGDTKIPSKPVDILPEVKRPKSDLTKQLEKKTSFLSTSVDDISSKIEIAYSDYIYKPSDETKILKKYEPSKNYTESKYTPLQDKEHKVTHEAKLEEYKGGLIPESAELSDVITRSEFKSEGKDLGPFILNAFNSGVTKSAATWGWLRGRRMQADEFMVFHRNEVPELVAFSPWKIAEDIPWLHWTHTTQYLNTVKQNAPFYGMHGTYVLNVPVGKYCKAFTKNEYPKIYDQGTYIIHDATFNFDKDRGDVFNAAADLIDQNTPYIKHGIYHILRIPAGKIAKITVNGQPYLLEHSEKPYVIKTPYFELKDREDKSVKDDQAQDPFIDASTYYINHGIMHRIRVPQGKLAKVWFGTRPEILEARDEPYEFRDPLFRIERNSEEKEEDQRYFFDVTSEYIQHGTIHRLRIPQGSYAKVWHGTRPDLLPARMEPYEFRDPQFRLEEHRKKGADGKPEYYADVLTPYIKHDIIHAIRVPAGKIAKVWFGTTPELLEASDKPYEIFNPQFRLDDSSLKYAPIKQVESKYQSSIASKSYDSDVEPKFEDVASPYINHGTIHRIRVPQGKLARVWFGTKPELLPARDEPYEYDDPQFKPDMDEKKSFLVDVLTPYINHDTIHILRVPAGKVAKAWFGNTPVLLPSRDKPYMFMNSQFKLDKVSELESFEDAYAPYIKHGTIHQLKVPAGKIAKVWLNSKALLLDSGDSPELKEMRKGLDDLIEESPGFYKINSPFFRVEVIGKLPNGKDNYFEDSTKQLIVHGSIKRIIPHTSEEAVAYVNGTLKVLAPPTDGKPIIRDDPTLLVEDEFIKTTVQTLEFPSKAAKKAKSEESKNIKDDELNYEVFTTQDGLRVGVKVLVTYKITEPELTLKELGRSADLNSHIEKITAADMAKVIQKCTSQNFLSYDYSTAKKASDAEIKNMDPFSQTGPKIMGILDEVKKEILGDLKKCGIELQRLNIETPKILDEKIIAEMSQFSIRTQKAAADRAAFEIENKLALQKKGQESDLSKIQQDRDNANLVSAAQARAQAAEQDALAAKTKAEGEANAKFATAQGEAKAREAEAIGKAKAKEEEAKGDAKAMELKSTAEARAKEITAEAEKKAIQATLGAKGEVYTKNPALLDAEVKMKSIEMFAGALKETKPSVNCILTAGDALNVLSKAFGTGMTMFSPSGAAFNTSPSLLPQHFAKAEEPEETKKHSMT